MIPVLFLLASTTTTAVAHPGHGGDAGAMFLHPFRGVDHLLVMLAVGVLATRVGGRALWAIPLGFLSMMVAGAALAGAGMALPSVELGIALSVLGIGGLIAVGARPSVAAATAIAGAVATLHGYAHGAEIGASAQLMVPLLAATAALHGAGIGLGLLSRQVAGERTTVALGDRLLGGVMVVVGAALLFG
jgi:urease accessory protein